MKIAIIGCGYIGTALAIFWSKKKHFLTATTRSPKKLKMLSKLVQKATIYHGGGDKEIYQLTKDNDVLCLTLSAENHNDSEKTYLATAQEIKKSALLLDEPKMLIFTSKGIVYGEQQGMWVDETSILNSNTVEGKALIAAEETLLSLEEQGWKVIILRLAEIYGPGREISKKIKSFQKKEIGGDGHNYINFVHQEDIVKGVDYLLSRQICGIFNLSDDHHPSEKEFYDEACSRLHLPHLHWNPSSQFPTEGNYRLSNYKIKKEGYELAYSLTEIT